MLLVSVRIGFCHCNYGNTTDLNGSNDMPWRSVYYYNSSRIIYQHSVAVPIKIRLSHYYMLTKGYKNNVPWEYKVNCVKLSVK